MHASHIDIFLCTIIIVIEKYILFPIIIIHGVCNVSHIVVSLFFSFRLNALRLMHVSCIFLCTIIMVIEKPGKKISVQSICTNINNSLLHIQTLYSVIRCLYN